MVGDGSHGSGSGVFGNKTKQEMFRERSSSKEEDREGLGSRDSEARHRVCVTRARRATANENAHITSELYIEDS